MGDMSGRLPGKGAISETRRRGQGATDASTLGCGVNAPGKGALSSLGLEVVDIETDGPPEGTISNVSSSPSEKESSFDGGFSSRRGVAGLGEGTGAGFEDEDWSGISSRASAARAGTLSAALGSSHGGGVVRIEVETLIAVAGVGSSGS